MALTPYQLEQARKKARASGKIPASDKKKKRKANYKSPTTIRQTAQDEINEYKLNSYGKPSTSTQDKAEPTAASGGSKSVRKITSGDSNPLVDKLRKKPFKYLK